MVAVSEPVRQRHTDYLGWRGKTCVIPNGVPDVVRNHADRHAVRGELGIGQDDFVFLAVGNARPEKTFEDLISAAVKVQAENDTRREFSVLIAGRIGDDQYSRSLCSKAQSSGVRGLRLLGFRSDVKRLYSAADAFVISSRSEGLPMVLLEAMTAGLPVIATRVGGIPSAVPPECGQLVEPQRPDELAQAMLEMLRWDCNTLDSMSRAARDLAVREYGVERMVRQYTELFAEVANSWKGRSRR